MRGRKCVVVGGGAVGTRKMQALIAAGAEVWIIAPNVTSEVREAAGTVTHVAASFSPEHLDKAFLVIAAANNAAVNASVAAAARERGVLLNIAGDAENETGDFVTMATLRRGDLLIGVTTGGAGPAVTARVRRSLERLFTEDWAEYLAFMAEMREMAKTEIADAGERAARLRRLAEHPTLQTEIAAGNISAAREIALSCLLARSA